MSKTLFITGATGFLGRHLIEELIKDGKTDFLYSFRDKPLAIAPENGVKLDLRDRETIAKHNDRLRKVDVLIHAAAYVSKDQLGIIDDMHRYIIDEVSSLTNILESMPNLQKIVHISSGSAAIAERDPTFYGLGKLFVEEMVAHYCVLRDINGVSLRFPQLYGPGEPHGTFVTKFMKSVIKNEQITLVNDGETVRDILYVKDAVGSILHAINADKTGVFTIAYSKPYSVREVLEEIIAVANPRFTNVLYLHDKATANTNGFSFHLNADNEKFGYELQYNLTQGLKATYNHQS